MPLLARYPLGAAVRWVKRAGTAGRVPSGCSSAAYSRGSALLDKPAVAPILPTVPGVRSLNSEALHQGMEPEGVEESVPAPQRTAGNGGLARRSPLSLSRKPLWQKRERPERAVGGGMGRPAQARRDPAL